jgi:hypothetical protein
MPVTGLEAKDAGHVNREDTLEKDPPVHTLKK